jgi:hypothetical protein
MLPTTLATGAIALGAVLALAAIRIKIEVGGAKVSDVTTTRTRLISAVLGIGLVGWGLWSVWPRSYEITAVTVIPQHRKYTCPRAIGVLVAVHARSAPGDVDYLVYLDGDNNEPLKHGAVGSNGTVAFQVQVPVPRGANGELHLVARTVFPNTNTASIAEHFECPPA